MARRLLLLAPIIVAVLSGVLMTQAKAQVAAAQNATPATAEGPVEALSPGARQSAAVVRKFWDAFNRAAWNELDELVTADYVHHPPGRALTLAQFKRGGGWVHNGMANYYLNIDSMLASEHGVAVRWTARGIHVGSFFGEVPTQREVSVQGMHFHALKNGRIDADWEVIDFDGFKEQLRRSPQ